jgi:cytoskeletal protein CcmA (bactofilin family)
MSKKPNPYTVTEHGTIATILGKDTSFHGTLTFKKPLQIAGEFIGEITSDGYLYISEGANIKANIKAHTVIVGGQVVGNVVATERLEMLSTGRVNGNIKTAKLQIADGVVFDGNCEMILPGKPV